MRMEKVKVEEKTRYAYEKRIKQLEQELSEAHFHRGSYKAAIQMIFDGVIEVVTKGSTHIDIAWILKQIKPLLK